MNSQDKALHNLLLKSHPSLLDQNRKSISWRLNQHMLKEHAMPVNRSPVLLVQFSLVE